MVGFGADGASVMMGHKGGVAALLKADVPHLIDIHCAIVSPTVSNSQFLMQSVTILT